MKGGITKQYQTQQYITKEKEAVELILMKGGDNDGVVTKKSGDEGKW